MRIDDVFRVYPSPEGGVAALQGLSLAVEEGELCVVLGPSGSGKSTLLRIVAGFDRASAGSVRVAGVDVGSLGGWGAARFRSRSIGYADQHYWRALAGELTARELVGIQLGLAGVDKEQRDARADELLERVGLGDRRDAHPRELSGGEQQRVALCAALASRPALLIADEPTGELDAATARDVLDADRRARARVGRHRPRRQPRPRLGGAGRSRHPRARRAHLGRARRRLRPATARSWSGAAAGSGSPRTCSARPGSIATRRPSFAAARSSSSRREQVFLKHKLDHVPHEQAVSEPPERASVSETQSPIVEARGLTKRFGAATPFERLDAAFAPGKLTVVTGPSGSGKTTLLLLLAGLELPDEGDVLLDGVSLAGLDRAGRAELRRTTLAFVGQTAGLTPFLGARENVELALELRGLPTDKAAPALAAVGLAEHADRPVAELSAGQRERAALARAVAVEPRVIVADEPTARLDGANALALGALLAEVARTTGATVICATHDPLLIEQADAELSLGST